MGHTRVHSVFNTQLTDRVLWYDGQSSFDPNRLTDLITRYHISYVTHNTDEIRRYNQNVPNTLEISVKDTCGELSSEWNIPEKYKNLDVLSYIMDRHALLTHDMSEDEIAGRELSLAVELSKYQAHGLTSVLRTIIWIIDTLEVNNIVWGVGRGSSVSSYVLYVIGVHDVDSYHYDLDIDDFLHS